MLLPFCGSKVKLQIDATRPYIPQVIIDKKKYEQVLDDQPCGLSSVWLIIKLPINPRKNVNKKRANLLLSCIKNSPLNNNNIKFTGLLT